MSDCKHRKLAIMRVGSVAETLTFEDGKLVNHENVPIQELRRVVVRCLDCQVVRTYEAGSPVPERITRLLEDNPYSVDEKRLLGNLLKQIAGRPMNISPGDYMQLGRLPLETPRLIVPGSRQVDK
jgi:hypothetical protein